MPSAFVSAPNLLHSGRTVQFMQNLSASMESEDEPEKKISGSEASRQAE